MEYDVIIIGSGPAGYTAGIYAKRYNLKTLIMGENPVGLIGDMYLVENYPGFPAIPGKELMHKFQEHYKGLNGEQIQTIIMETKKEEKDFLLKDIQGKEYKTKTIIFATGSERRKLGAKGEDTFYGKGISYCPVCDGPFAKERKVFVIGGGNAAMASAILLKQYTDKVAVIHRRNEFRAMPFFVQQAKDKGVEFILEANIKEFKGDKRMNKILLEQKGEKKEIEADFAFIEIGQNPKTELFQNLGGEITKRNCINVDNGMRTNIKGIFAAGDCTSGSDGYYQVITASAEGALAAKSAYQYLKEGEK